MSKNLFTDSDDESGAEDANCDKFQLRTNQNYVKHYNEQCKRQLLQKFKDKKISGGSDQESYNSSSDSSSSDDDDEEINPAFDQEFLKAMACLKRKDPSMYDKNTKFFDDQTSGNNTDQDMENSDGSNDNEEKAHSLNNKFKNKKDKPITLKDYERQVILEKEGKFEDDSDDDILSSKRMNRDNSPCIAEQEKQLKDEFKRILDKENENEKDSEEEFGGIFKPRTKNADETNKDADCLEWLAGKQECLDDNTKKTLEPLKDYWSSTKLPASEKFLRDFVLNKGYVEAKSYSEIPTYDEIVEDEKNLLDDEKDLEEQAIFEQKYNYRFEEEDPEFIKRYPRTIAASVRRTNDKRKEKRRETKNRKQQEKEEKMRELEIVKEAKRKEILDKIEKLKLVTGNEELNIKQDELDEEFDPDAHDKRMAELFNDEYYQVEEGEEKPHCPSDIEDLQIENWDNYDPRQDQDYENDDLNSANEPHCEDEDFNMDCDYNPEQAKQQLQQELIGNSRHSRGKNRKRTRFLKMLNADKPLFDPNGDKTYAQYVEEYYNLSYEDVIDGQPCRFKYVETTPNDFGLSVEEILLAKNKELNQWASLKKAVQIRPDRVEKREQNIYKLKGKNIDLKRKILKSLYGEQSDDEADEKEDQSDKEENRTKSVENETTDKPSDQEDNTVTENLAPTTQKRKRKRKKKNNAGQGLINDDNQLQNTNNENKKMKLNLSESNNNSNTDRQNNYEELKPRNKTLDEGEQASSKEPVNTELKDTKSSEQVSKITKDDIKRKIFSKKSKLHFNAFKNVNVAKSSPCIKLDNEREISDERLRAYGSSMYKFKKQKYKKKPHNK